MSRRIINDFASFSRLYRYAKKEIKTKLLDEFCELNQCHRKSAIRKLKQIGKKGRVRVSKKI